jgi:glycosyltransferase involved in cell wall biosynthesis
LKDFLVKRFFFIVFLFALQTTFSYAEKAIVVLTTSYNNQKWVEKNLRSIFEQAYSNYRVIYIDDASQDLTANFVEVWVKNHPKKLRFDLIRNQERVGALANIYHGIHDHCADEEIIVSLDGDDWFYDDQVLRKINRMYSTQNVWLTHGTLLEFPSQQQGWSLPIPSHIIAQNAFRTYRCPSHLRTFYAWLFKRIRLEDLQYEGHFFR